MKHLPNILTVIRFFLIPVMGVFLYNAEKPWMYFCALFVYAVACTTDVIDGHIARKHNIISKFGQLADPLADKLLSLTCVIMLAQKQAIFQGNEWWQIALNWLVPSLLILKELLMIIGAIIVLKSNKVTRSSAWFGKAATVFYFSAFVLLMAANGLRVVNILPEFNWLFMLIAQSVLLFALVFSIIAFFMYVSVYLDIRRNVPKAGKNE